MGLTPYYDRGGITLFHGDSRIILPQLDVKVDLVLTDPPYNFESSGGGFYGNWHGNGHEARTYIAELEKSDCVSYAPLESIDLLRSRMDKFYGYFFCNKELIDKYIGIARQHGYMFDVLVMAKNNPIPACNSHHLHDLEYVVMLREKGTQYYKSDIFDDNRKFFMVNCDGERLHPAEKPEAFIYRMMKVSSTLDSVILDPFLGSGTTAVAAKKLGRRCIGIEIDRTYLDLAIKRLQQEVMPLFPTEPSPKGEALIERPSLLSDDTFYKAPRGLIENEHH